MLEALKQRLRAAMKDRGYTQKSLALKSGLNETAVRDILQGRSKRPSYDTLRAIARTLRMDLGELTGDKVRSKALAEPAWSNFDVPAPFHIGKEQYLPVPVYDIRAAAGLVGGTAEPMHHQMFRSLWLHQVVRAPEEALAVIMVAGDSMWDTLHDGDHVLVDRSIRTPYRDGIYVLRIGEELLVKRVSMNPETKKLTVASDNPRYPTFADVDPASLEVVGRVIWIGRNMG